MLCHDPRLMQDIAPMIIGEMVVDELFHPCFALLLRSVPLVFHLMSFLAGGIANEMTEIGCAQPIFLGRRFVPTGLVGVWALLNGSKRSVQPKMPSSWGLPPGGWQRRERGRPEPRYPLCGPPGSRDALDLECCEKFPDLCNVRVFAHRHDRGAHDLSCSPMIVADR